MSISLTTTATKEREKTIKYLPDLKILNNDYSPPYNLTYKEKAAQNIDFQPTQSTDQREAIRLTFISNNNTRTFQTAKLEGPNQQYYYNYHYNSK